ncbi:MAG: ArsI/CadI family heavy metal resistance metalloenzyme [Rhodospirillales bacterium]
MKRLHIHTKVNDLEQAIDFYSALFAMAPTVVKDDYAKWMVDDPRVNFAVSDASKSSGDGHFGIQVETPEELSEIYGRLAKAGRPVLEEGRTTCCYADQEKSWISDPDGKPWEAFLTFNDNTVYGTGAPLENLDGEAKTRGRICCP